MQRREILRNLLFSIGFMAAPTDEGRVQAKTPAVNENGREGFYDLLNEARAAFYAEEYSHAFDLYTRSLNCIPPGEPSAVSAEIIESRSTLSNILKNAEAGAAQHRARMRVNEHDPEAHFWFAFTLTRAGHNEEALREYTRAMELGDGQSQESCWLGIGLSHYRQGRYAEALPWFEKISLKDKDEEDVSYVLGVSQYQVALEHRLLIYSKTARVQAAEAAAGEYALRYGRLSLRERRALAKAGIDSDAIYLEQAYFF